MERPGRRAIVAVTRPAFGVGALLAVSGAVLGACTDLSGNCELNLNCPESGGTTTGAGAGGSTAEPGLGKLGDPCPEVGVLACKEHAQKSQLICGPDKKWESNGTCNGDTFCDTSTGVGQGTCKPLVALCAGKNPGDSVCDGQKRVKCGPDLVTTEELDSCVNQTCVSGVCVGACAPGQTRCMGNTPQSCDATSGTWQNGTACVDQTCVDGACMGACAPGQTTCSGNTLQDCDATGVWDGGTPCANQTCVVDACAGECAVEQTRCVGNTPQSCDANGAWENGLTCVAETHVCIEGVCVIPPSCDGLPATCGPLDNESCCAITVLPGGTYDRSNDPDYPATVSNFRLDRFEITVGRFRRFVEAYPASMPADGAGAHPLIAGSGWNTAWDGSLPVDQLSLRSAAKCDPSYQTWTDVVGANENLPMNCLDWYEAFAFCAWDGGRLPTEAEWNYAAAGGNEQREVPWGAAAADSTYAVFQCYGDGFEGSCAFADILKVGSKSPKGDGKWGQADLGGSVWEWNLDWHQNPYPNPCDDCAALAEASVRVERGGSWHDFEVGMSNFGHFGDYPTNRWFANGVRCARAQ